MARAPGARRPGRGCRSRSQRRSSSAPWSSVRSRPCSATGARSSSTPARPHQPDDRRGDERSEGHRRDAGLQCRQDALAHLRGHPQGRGERGDPGRRREQRRHRKPGPAPRHQGDQASPQRRLRRQPEDLLHGGAARRWRHRRDGASRQPVRPTLHRRHHRADRRAEGRPGARLAHADARRRAQGRHAPLQVRGQQVPVGDREPGARATSLRVPHRLPGLQPPLPRDHPLPAQLERLRLRHPGARPGRRLRIRHRRDPGHHQVLQGSLVGELRDQRALRAQDPVGARALPPAQGWARARQLPRAMTRAWGRSPVLHAAVLVLVTGALYLPTVRYPFVWDDTIFIVNNPHLESTHYLREYFTANFCTGVRKDCAFYRPVVLLSYLTDFETWGWNPLGFHLTNVALHVAVVLLFYGLVCALFRRPRAALLAALLFAVHPLRVESVALVAARTDPPAALCILASLWAFARWRRGAPRAAGFYLLSLLAFALALLTKEIAVAGPALLVAYDFLVGRPWRGVADLVGRIPAYLPYAGIMVLYLLVRRAALGYSTAADLLLDTLPSRLATVPAILWDYVRLELFPHPLLIYHGHPTLFGSEALASAFGCAVLIGGLALAVVAGRRWSPAISFGLLWFVLFLLPVLNVIPGPWPMVVERFSYVPSLGLTLALGLALDHALDAPPAIHRGLVGGVTAALVVLTTLTAMHLPVWGDEVRLWEDTARRAPQFRHNLGKLYQDRNRPDDALAQYRILVETGAATAQTYFNMGILYEDKDDAAQAIAYYREAI